MGCIAHVGISVGMRCKLLKTFTDVKQMVSPYLVAADAINTPSVVKSSLCLEWQGEIQLGLGFSLGREDGFVGRGAA